MRNLLTLCCLACLFWLVMFSPWTALHVNFWAVMTAATGILAGSALYLGRRRLSEAYAFKPRYILIGLGSAVVLYGVFLLGHAIASRLFDFTAPQIAGIYSIKSQASPALIGALLVLWIGPAEEIFWRGYVQHALGKRYGMLAGFVITCAVYALVHIWAFNFMLFAAAALVGLFWGAMYWRYRSVWPGLISHAAWDLAIFVLWPVG